MVAPSPATDDQEVRLTGGNLAPVGIAYKYSGTVGLYSADVTVPGTLGLKSLAASPALRGCQSNVVPGGRPTRVPRVHDDWSVTCTVTGPANAITTHLLSVRNLTTEGPSASSTRTVGDRRDRLLIRRGVSTWLDARLDGFPVVNGIYVYRTASGSADAPPGGAVIFRHRPAGPVAATTIRST